MSVLWKLCIVLLCMGIPCSEAFPRYKDQIPNGYNVPHPCTDNVKWDGVGHINLSGGGPRNPFGEVSV